MKFVVGLGNPTREYQGTRHNVGFAVLSALRLRWKLDEGRKAFGGRFNDAGLLGPHAVTRVFLLEPHTYMNRSGQAVREMLAFYKANCDQVLIVLDDMALALGRIRARTGGSPGGHKGLGDVQRALGTDQVPRLRIGIGSPDWPIDSTDYVLGRFRPDEIETIDQAVHQAAKAVEDWACKGLAYVMNQYNPKSENGNERKANGNQE